MANYNAALDITTIEDSIQYQMDQESPWAWLFGFPDVQVSEKLVTYRGASPQVGNIITSELYSQLKEHELSNGSARKIPMIGRAGATPFYGSNGDFEGKGIKPPLYNSLVATHDILLPFQCTDATDWALRDFQELESEIIMQKNMIALYDSLLFNQAIYEGRSENLTASAVPSTQGDGLGMAKVLPRYIAKWDNSTHAYVDVTYSSDYATYAGNVISACSGLSTTNKIDLVAVQKMITYFQRRCKPADINGQKKIVIIITKEMMDTILGDGSSSAINVINSFKSNAFFGQTLVSGIFYEYMGALLWVQPLISRMPYYNGTTLDFFNYSAGALTTFADRQTSSWDKPQDSGNNQSVNVAIALGANIIAEAYGTMVDHKLGQKIRNGRQWHYVENVPAGKANRVKEWYATKNSAYCRLDFANGFDDTGAGSTVVESNMVMFLFSKSA